MKGIMTNNKITSPCNHDTKSVHWLQEKWKVRFMHIPDEEEKKRVWYQASDFRKFREERVLMVKLVQAIGVDAVEQIEDLTLRGLEPFLLRKKLVQRRQEAWDAVFDEQNHQEVALEINRPQLISKQYRTVSLYSQMDAHARAQAAMLGKSTLPQQNSTSEEFLTPAKPQSSKRLSRFMSFGKPPSSLEKEPSRTLPRSTSFGKTLKHIVRRRPLTAMPPTMA
jgi:hypothetical protein